MRKYRELNNSFDLLYPTDYLRAPGHRSQRRYDAQLISQYKITKKRLWAVRLTCYGFVFPAIVSFYYFCYVFLKNFITIDANTAPLVLALIAVVSTLIIVIVPLGMTYIYYTIIKKLKIIN